ncbi:Frag1/DRAM/Sfk1 family-domain-containing protein, partial [Thamnocephalis sphaerospora]
AFLVALVVACLTHYEKVVRNQYYGYPDEWFPSVSATTGDRYPARSIFQILIALTSGPRFAILALWYLHAVSKTRTPSMLAKVVLVVGLIRTVSCGVFVYITSTDDHDIHDIGMLVYIACTFPYMLGTIWYERRLAGTSVQQAVRWRQRICTAFIVSLAPLIYFFIQHKVHHVKGAYTKYAFVEWSLIFYDVAFDGCSSWCFRRLQLQVVDAGKAGEAALLGGTGTADSSYGQGKNIASYAAAAISCACSTLSNMENIYFFADTYLGFIFWSLLTAVPLAIWYFPLWHMGLSGDELFLFANVGAVVLAVPLARRLVNSHRGFVHLLTVLTLVAYKFPAPEHRLYLTAFGSFASCVAWFSSFSARTSDRNVYAWLLGLIASCVIKAMWRSNNPVWPIMHAENGGWNGSAAMAAGTTALSSSSRDASPTRKAGHAGTSSLDWLPSSFGFGSLLFALHTVFSDSTTPLRWSVDGYPSTGAQPVPWGALSIAAMCGGLLLAHRRLALTLLWFGAGVLSIIIFSATSGWFSFLGGLLFAVFLFSLAPNFALSLGTQPVGRSLAASLLTYNILMLAHVWTVAYEFVPGGPLLRERTGLVMAMMTAALAVGFAATRKYAHLRAYPSTVRHPQEQQAYDQRRQATRSIVRRTAIMLASLGAIVYLARIPLRAPQPHIPAEHRAFTAGIWTIHFGLDNDMWASEKRMHDAIDELGLDVIGLLESDLQRIITGNRDLTQSLAESLNMYADYGPAASKHTWGCTMLSKFPIVRSSHHLLPSPDGELACAIYATLDVHGSEVDVIVSHNGQEENLLDRRLQTTELARIIRTTSNPIVFLGYVVSKPFGEVYNILMGDGQLNDVDPTDWDRWCEYIGFRGVKRIGYARISHGGITDTEIQSAKFQLLDAPSNPAADRAAAIKHHTQNLAAGEGHRVPALQYPPQFRGTGVRGHRYHVFDEPRYF